MKDIKAIRAELKETTDPEREKQLRRLLQRLNDQHKASKKKKIESEEAIKQRSKTEEEFREGRQPHFKNKCKYIVQIYDRNKFYAMLYLFHLGLFKIRIVD